MAQSKRGRKLPRDADDGRQNEYRLSFSFSLPLHCIMLRQRVKYPDKVPGLWGVYFCEIADYPYRRFYFAEADVRVLTFLVLCSLLLAACSQPAEPTPVPLTPAQAEGKRLFGALPGNCATCHSLEADVRIIGPSLAGIASRAASRMEGVSAQEYLETSILRPGLYVVDGYPDAMPVNIAKQLTSPQLSSLVEFLLTLK
jgi:mono/diheme cytochrome c family protein